jgi:hypothetical protein
MVAPYRNDHDALMARLVGLIDELASLRSRTSALRDLERTERDVEREIADVRREVTRVAPTRLPLLERVAVASPCSVAWSSMTGDDRTRFCAQCQKHVYNVASMGAEEAESFLRNAGGDACLRIYRRADGTVLTSDCAVGVRRRRRRRAFASLLGGSMVAAGALLAVDKARPPVPVVLQQMTPPLPPAPPLELIADPPPPEVPAELTPQEHHPVAGRMHRVSPEGQLDAALAHVRSLLDQRAKTTDPAKRRAVEAEIRAASQRVVELSPKAASPQVGPAAL